MSRVSVRRPGWCALVAILSLSMAGCIWWPHNIKVGEYDCATLTDSGIFYGKPEKARVDEFTHYDVAKQYAVFICARDYIEPPALEFVDAFALNGEKAIGLLKARLMDAPRDSAIQYIVYALEEMVRLETYDVTGDEELMRLVDERVKGIKDPFWKRMAEKDVHEIRDLCSRAARLSVENGGEHFNRKEIFPLLRSEGFSGWLDIYVDLRPVGEIEVGAARLKLFIYARDYYDFTTRDTKQRKLLLIFSPAHYLGKYILDQFPTEIRGNMLEFPEGEKEGNSIVFDSELPPKKIHLGGKVRELSK
jgi:hypothetical protein